MTLPVSKHLRRICPALLVREAKAAAEDYGDRLGFAIMCAEEAELAIVDRDGCRIMLKRGTPAFNRDRCGADMEFYDLFIHCDSMPAFDALYAEFQGKQPIGLGPIESWGGIRLFPARDLDGYKVYFARSV